MKKNILSILLAIQTLFGFGQFGEGSPETIKNWKSRTLIVVRYPGGDKYNEVVSEVVKERWYNDKIEFVDYFNLKEQIKRDNIVVLNIKQWWDYKIPVLCLTTRLNGSFLYKFGPKSDGWAYTFIHNNTTVDWDDWVKNYEKQPVKNRSIDRSFIARGVKVLNESSEERIKLLLDVLFNTIDNFKLGEYGYYGNLFKKLNYTYNTRDNVEKFRSKILMIEKKTIPKYKGGAKLFDENHLQTLYPKVKIVSEEELSEAIKNKDNDKVYLNAFFSNDKIAQYQSQISIIDLAERKIVFTGREKSKNKVSKPKVKVVSPAGPSDKLYIQLYELMLTTLKEW